jgi:4-amino-4-deoxy-L-arabinose transferase-like glycosyltransferase
MASERARPALALLLAAYLALALHYGAVTPVLEAPDEVWHVGYVKYLADGYGLPVLSADRPDLQESHQPPLYYALGAALTFWIDTHDLPQLSTSNPHWGAGGRTPEIDNKNLYVHGWPQERFPYAGAALAIHIVRVLSALLGVGTLLCVYALARELLGARHGAEVIALSAAGFVAFNPQFLYLSGAVNNDALATTVSALGLWLIARVALGRAWPAPWQLGVVIGLGLLTKWSVGALYPAALVALAFRAYPAGGWRAVVRAAFTLTIAMLLVSGWYYVRNQIVYGDPLALNRVVQIFETRQPEPSIWQALQELPGFEPSFWGRFGWENIPAPPWFDLYVGVMDRLAAVGLIVLGAGWALAWRRGVRIPEGGARPLSRGEAGALLALGAFGLVLTVLFVQWVRTTFPVGRHLFPGLALAGLALAVGLGALGRMALRTVRLPLTAGDFAAPAWLPVLCVTAAIAPLAWIAPNYEPPPAPAAAELAGITRTDADVGGVMRLLGYRGPEGTLRPGQLVTVTLYWQALAPADRDWTIFLHLWGSDGQLVTQRDTYPAFGRISTRFMETGQVWSERYVLWIPAERALPEQMELRVGLYDEQTGVRAPARDGDWVLITKLTPEE